MVRNERYMKYWNSNREILNKKRKFECIILKYGISLKKKERIYLKINDEWVIVHNIKYLVSESTPTETIITASAIHPKYIPAII